MKWQVPPTAATTKGGHFLPVRLFGENWRGKTGPARIWLGKFFDFCLANKSRRGIRVTSSLTWQRIYTFWQKLMRQGPESRNCEFCLVNVSPARENHHSCLANDSPAGGLVHIFSSLGSSKDQNLSAVLRYPSVTTISCVS